jgi:chromosome segregation ATPase
MAEQRACECEAALKEATAQMRSLTSRNTALEAQFRAKESEAEELQAAMTASRKGISEIESRGLMLQADLRAACADIANLTAQLGVQTAVAQSREVEIEELKAAVREAGFRQEAAGDALDDTVGENRRLTLQCAQLQCSLKTQVTSGSSAVTDHLRSIKCRCCSLTLECCAVLINARNLGMAWYRLQHFVHESPN